MGCDLHWHSSVVEFHIHYMYLFVSVVSGQFLSRLTVPSHCLLSFSCTSSECLAVADQASIHAAHLCCVIWFVTGDETTSYARCRDVNKMLRSETQTFHLKSETRSRPSKIFSRLRQRLRRSGLKHFSRVTYKWIVGPYVFSRLPRWWPVVDTIFKVVSTP